MLSETKSNNFFCKSILEMSQSSLKSFNIFCQVHYIPVYKQPYYQERYHYPDSKCKNAELYYSRCLTLPMYPDLDEDIIDFVIDVVLDSVNRYPEFN